jgi:beta-alanine degradation protein BauB
VRIMEVTFQPGQKIDLHSHPKHVVYVLKGGSLKIAPEGKEPQEMKLKAGDTVIIPGEKHWAENLSKSVVKLVVVEIKGK